MGVMALDSEKLLLAPQSIRDDANLRFDAAMLKRRLRNMQCGRASSCSQISTHLPAENECPSHLPVDLKGNDLENASNLVESFKRDVGVKAPDRVDMTTAHVA